ncbi:hypothetical protein LTR99_005005 [Exophiala xenobiotica]|uniref:C3H1-type domain-containing protein n=1 Tax=Vermiconidia calcicola TaxID=1690605 RepID=A0AAV9PW59_9PEZI|nr:hypothetical protein LTR96_003840 [Exophiala xenobiotica]KAK5528244.1 hypothetical protein LTR25_010551 [Vermiconidia calcicola]KAK5534134.1 hypothetical protein LTR23_008927 [Chaetothyriales sp. CCFEE 6169]KAK5303244.1 hypothetical protein LTR99_005005 [Exophiala xenobiotica]KAK5333345.1 hypothetical protein LTR98_010550 [Exophiala xenobiotica]
MAVLPNHHDLQQRLQDYRAFDDARQSEVDFLVQTCMRLNTERLTLQSDLDDERDTRRSWKKRAEQAEAATQRKFVVVLVDGDGYQFRKSYYNALATSGGSKAASELYTEVLNNLKNAVSSSGINADCDVLVNIYANKTGLARTLTTCDYINHPSQIDQFFCSFTQSRSLFQFIDCGPGKERVDAKLRDTFRFYAHNAQCQRIYLACSHDNGYIAELDKYRHDMIVMPKVMLIHAAQTPSAARAYAGLPFEYTRFDSVFEVSGLQTVSKADTSYFTPPPDTPYFDRSPTEQHIHELTPTASRSSHSSNTAPCGPTPLAPVTLNTKSAAKVTSPAPVPPPPPPIAEVAKTQPANTSDRTGEGKSGIPINRFGQRVDWKLRIPTTAEMDEFERRIGRRKLCNEHHLRDNCESYNCKYDHGPIDASMKNTLRYKARSIPCTHGSKCRRQDCFYGHQCPWGNNDCGNPKCSFIKTGLHDIKDLEISRVVAAQPEN